MDFLDPIVQRYRSRFTLFWLRGDAAFADPEVYKYCKGERVTYFIRLPANAVLNRLIDPYLTRPVGRPPKSGIQVKLVDFRYQAKTWDRERRVIAKIEWRVGELFPKIGFIVTNSRLSAGKVLKLQSGRGDVENRIKEAKNTLRWDKTSRQRFASNQARLLMGVIAYNLLHMLRQFYLSGEEVRRSMEWLIKRLIKVGAKVAYHGRRWYIHVASTFPLAYHYRAVFGCRDTLEIWLTGKSMYWYAQILQNEPRIWQQGENSGRRMIFRSAVTPIRGSKSIVRKDSGPKRSSFVRSRDHSGYYDFPTTAFGGTFVTLPLHPRPSI